MKTLLIISIVVFSIFYIAAQHLFNKWVRIVWPKPDSGDELFGILVAYLIVTSLYWFYLVYTFKAIL